MALWEVKSIKEVKTTKPKDGKVETSTKQKALLENLGGLKMQVETNGDAEISIGDMYNFKPDKSQRKLSDE